MRKVCAWCSEVIEDGDGPTSHSICEACEDKHFPVEVVAFNWDHPSLSISHGPRRVSEDFSVPWFVRPDFWSSDRYGLFLLACSLTTAVLLGYWWGVS